MVTGGGLGLAKDKGKVHIVGSWQWERGASRAPTAEITQRSRKGAKGAKKVKIKYIDKIIMRLLLMTAVDLRMGHIMESTTKTHI